MLVCCVVSGSDSKVAIPLCHLQAVVLLMYFNRWQLLRCELCHLNNINLTKFTVLTVKSMKGTGRVAFIRKYCPLKF